MKSRAGKLYAQTHQKTVEVAVEKKVPYEKCENVTVLLTGKQKKNAIAVKAS